MSTEPNELQILSSRVAMVGIITGLVLTAAGMMIRSPILGGIGLVSLAVLVIFRHQIARRLPAR
ncbi:hypothetical protein OSH11_02040 [Kaistia dalseonensis]|uniref:Uncharacterized protein n=1 Tax=Kaistia dalseonensis TaxID=410840 RepID=A0ABU0H159_9HYPH|nr:hypothetical protein [Kaistia dalseonensis]MCX5493476.1 hypothetical protein [Kaistia dalseonensis]MDQ0436035.1 hypothetical protein [Kaistia dalseonensis]